MEVHHHPKVERKRFKEYLLEGLMIFLAVTLGFIAENIRERITENKIANELAESLYKEIYSDSVRVHEIIEGRVNEKEKDMNHYIDYIRDSSLVNLSKSFYNSVFTGLLKAYYFEPRDGILSQLRNSGSLRYFKNHKLQDAIGELSVAIANVRMRNSTEKDFIVSTSRPFLIKHFDYSWFTPDVYKIKGLADSPQILNANEFDRQEAINIAVAFLLLIRSTRNYEYKEYADVNHQLMETLRKEYRVKNE